MPGMKVLIVDDDAAMRASLEEQLQLDEEFTTHVAGTGGEALEKVKGGYFDIILLDVRPVSYTHLTLPTICSV